MLRGEFLACLIFSRKDAENAKKRCSFCPYYKIAENELSRETLRRIKNLVAALFYAETCQPEKLRESIDVLVDMLKDEHPSELELFVNWMQKIFNNEHQELVDEIADIREILTMRSTGLTEKEIRDL